MKAHIRRWVNEKHDVVTAEDMKTALKSHGWLKGVRAAVVQVDTSRENTTNKIPGISLRQRQADDIESQEEEEVPEEDLEVLESEDCIQAIHQEVYRDTETPNHPIQVGTVKVCELSRAGNLSSLELAQLREVCTVLQLQTDGNHSRKRTYTVPLDAYAVLHMSEMSKFCL